MNGEAGQRGFTLLETLVAGALSTALVLTISSAVLGSMHATAHAVERTELSDHALNILSDLREATAYDSAALAKLAGRSVTSTLLPSASLSATMLTTTISVSRPATPTAPLTAVVTVADASGLSVVESQSLFVEAPAPGSVVEQATPTAGPEGAP